MDDIKNFGTDLVRREDVLKLIYDLKERYTNDSKAHPINYGTLLDMCRLVRKLPSVSVVENVKI